MALLDSLNQTNLGLGGNTPTGYTPANLVNSLGSTQLDLNDGATPTKYLDNPPQ